MIFGNAKLVVPWLQETDLLKFMYNHDTAARLDPAANRTLNERLASPKRLRDRVPLEL